MRSGSGEGGLYCSHCGTVVIEGPRGGYVCGQCYYTVVPEEQPLPPAPAGRDARESRTRARPGTPDQGPDAHRRRGSHRS